MKPWCPPNLSHVGHLIQWGKSIAHSAVYNNIYFAQTGGNSWKAQRAQQATYSLSPLQEREKKS